MKESISLDTDSAVGVAFQLNGNPLLFPAGRVPNLDLLSRQFAATYDRPCCRANHPALASSPRRPEYGAER